MTNLLLQIHLLFAILAVIICMINLAERKGSIHHKMIGWIWVISILFVAISSFWITELNHGKFSFIHILTIWTLTSLTLAILYIKRKNVRGHAVFIIVTMIGLIVVGILALLPGRFLSHVVHYG